MLLDIDVWMRYQLSGPTVLLTVEAAQVAGQEVVSSSLDIDCATVTRVEGEGGLGTRIWVNAPVPELRVRYLAQVRVTREVPALEGLTADAAPTLPGEVLSYLRPSRFCQSDMFTAFVARRFGHLGGGAKIAAIRDWVTGEMAYVSSSSHAGTTVLDTFAAREGVCRDYAHMVCALARAAQIPARYASVYGYGVTPQDFHAVAQVWLQGAWRVVDATGMCTEDSVVLIAAGRDACDVAFMETETPAQLLQQGVVVARAPAGGDDLAP